MSRPKIARKSTSVDMTAMCDVAFLLLSFFILTTKFKASEAITVETPSSVSSKVAPEKDVTLVYITKDGKVFVSLDNEEVKEELANQLNANKGAGLSPADINAFKTAGFFGTPISKLKSALQIPADKLKGDVVPGIPAQDSSNNEMIDWMRYIVAAHASTGTKMNLLFKGDNAAKYPAFKNVIAAFKKSDQFKFQMVTNAEGVPEGTDLWRKYMRGETASAEEQYFQTKKLLAMAEMDTSGGGHKKGPGVKKAKKASTRVDLTPMVDLGFLLITFFIFTTTMSQPTAMRLFLPKDTDKPEEQNKAKESGALTLLLGNGNRVYYYEGQLDPNGANFKSSTMKQVRDIIITKKRSTNAEDLVIVIKPGNESTYKDVVDILDEMTINDIKRYALVDISEGEESLVKMSDQSAGG